MRTFFRKSNTYSYLSIFVVCFIAAFCFIAFSTAIKQNIIDKLNRFENRDIAFQTEEPYDMVFEKTKNIPNGFIYPEILTTISISGEAYLIHYSNHVLITKGRNIVKEKEVILPFSKGAKFLNQELELKFQNEKIKVLVVGLYDDTLVPEKNFIYFSKSDFDAFQNTSSIYLYHIVLEEEKDVKNTIKWLQEKGYYANIYDSKFQSEIKTLTLFETVSEILMGVLCLFVICFFYFMLKNILVDEKMDLAILKTVGYKNSQILINILGNFLVLILISYSIASGLILFLVPLLSNLTIHFFQIPLSLSLYQLFFVLLISILLLILSVVIGYYKIHKVEPLILFEE